ncbi:LuxR C-terminal-related transcriptional regulator [Streptomyces spinosus]|uniref:LuxR C-terminal-related transcriptional regulator n=1 Tax=Streptomyces spinosus TaxID=2872623 RepID=UPI001CEC0712|nr:LuxR C-terminal-related transcriptional regulator [Streptomyces spinosus]
MRRPVDVAKAVALTAGDLMSSPAVMVRAAATLAEAARITAREGVKRLPDVRLPDGDGIRVCRELRERMPELACLMLTSFDDEEALPDAIMAGASGYVLKQIKGSDLVSAVRTVASGQSMPDPATTTRLMRSLRAGPAEVPPLPPELAGLSPREGDILALIGDGLTNREIGRKLYLSEKTVKNYISRPPAKLGVQRRVQAVVLGSHLDEHGTPPGSHEVKDRSSR